MQYEYLHAVKKESDFDIKNTIQDYLNIMGRQGWILTTIQSGEKQRFRGSEALILVYNFFFMRPKK